MFEELNKSILNKPPALHAKELTKNDLEDWESEEDSPLILAKSNISLGSTVSSPLLTGGKVRTERLIEDEEEVCYDFH